MKWVWRLQMMLWSESRRPRVQPLKEECGPTRICTPVCVDPMLAVAFTQPYSKICVALSIVRPNTQTDWGNWRAETEPWQQWVPAQRAWSRQSQRGAGSGPSLPPKPTGTAAPCPPRTAAPPTQPLEKRSCHKRDGWCCRQDEQSRPAQTGFHQWNLGGIKQVHSLMNYSKIINSLRETFATV